MAIALPVYETTAEAPASLALPPYALDASAPASLALPTWLLTEKIPSALTVTPSGGVVIEGGADIMADPWFPSGGVTAGGESTVSAVSVLLFEFYAYGGVQLSGAATVATAWSEFVPSGGASVGGAAAVSDYYSTHIPSGGIQVGGVANIQHTASGGVLAGGAATVIAIYPLMHVPAGGVVLGGAAVIAGAGVVTGAGGVVAGGAAVVGEYFPMYVPSGGVELGGAAIAFALPAGSVSTPENPYAEAYPGWAVNLDTGAPSRYMGLPATSMFQHAGKTYVTNAAGVYELTGGSDAGQPIRAAVTLPRSDFSDGHEKRVPWVYVGARTAGPLVLKVITDSPSVRYYAVTSGGASMQGYRVQIGKGLKSRYWQFRLENKAGADFDLDSIEILPNVLRQRGA